MQVTLYRNGTIQLDWLDQTVTNTYDDLAATRDRLVDQGFTLCDTDLPDGVVLTGHKTWGEN